MYDPRTNSGIGWHDLTAEQKIKHLVDENTWLAGMLSARMGKETTHEQNVKIARRFVREHYHELWEAVHRDRACNTWPANGSLEAMIADR